MQNKTLFAFSKTQRRCNQQNKGRIPCRRLWSSLFPRVLSLRIHGLHSSQVLSSACHLPSRLIFRKIKEAKRNGKQCSLWIHIEYFLTWVEFHLMNIFSAFKEVKKLQQSETIKILKESIFAVLSSQMVRDWGHWPVIVKILIRKIIVMRRGARHVRKEMEERYECGHTFCQRHRVWYVWSHQANSETQIWREQSPAVRD